MVLYLKQRKQIALHVACGDITDVEIKNDKFIINVYDGMLLNLLNTGKKDIEEAIRWQGLEFEVDICVKETQTSKADIDVKRLQEIFEEVEIIKHNFNWR